VRVSYNRFFKLLIDKQMKKGELCKKAGISTNVVGKMGKGQNLTVDVLVKICGALGCIFDDIMELLPDSAGNTDVSEGM
jgi:DNA-binding Xre family transcriptional regulator